MMIRRLAILGATGDLTGRFLLPAIAALRAAGEIDDAFELAAIGRDDWSEAEYREWLPVVEIDGRRRFTYHVQPDALRKAVAQAVS